MSYLQKAKEWEAKHKIQKQVKLQLRVAGKLAKDQTEEQSQAVDFQAETEKITLVLMKQGLARIYSETLSEEVWWARDKKEARKTPDGTVVYTLDELKELARGNATREDLLQMHGAKKLLGGTFISPTNAADKGGEAS